MKIMPILKPSPWDLCGLLVAADYAYAEQLYKSASKLYISHPQVVGNSDLSRHPLNFHLET